MYFFEKSGINIDATNINKAERETVVENATYFMLAKCDEAKTFQFTTFSYIQTVI